MNQSELDSKIKAQLLGQKIRDVRLYTINPPLRIANQKIQMTDAGLELFFDNSSTFSFGWQSKYELHNISFNGINELIEDNDTYEFDLSLDKYWKSIKGQSITDVWLHWTWFEDIEGNHFDIPDMIELKLNMNSSILLAAMDFDFNNLDDIDSYNLDQEGHIVSFFDTRDIELIKKKRPNNDPENIGFIL